MHNHWNFILNLLSLDKNCNSNNYTILYEPYGFYSKYINRGTQYIKDPKQIL